MEAHTYKPSTQILEKDYEFEASLLLYFKW